MKLPFSLEEKEIEVLGSRFIAIMMPISSFDEIQKCLDLVKEKYPKATHYPYAARFLPFEKASDDGEPSHSTGVPLLSLLQQKEIDHVFLCVVRYFGGTKLGLSRLTRTYRESAAELLSFATFAIETPIKKMNISLSYSDFEYLKRLAKDSEIELKNIDYGISVTLDVLGDGRIITDILEKLPNININNCEEVISRRRIEK